MKSLILFLMFFSMNCFAIETSFFDDSYPNFQNYQEMVFSKVRTYFEALKANSFIQMSNAHSYQFKVTDVDNEDVVNLQASIHRIKSPNRIIEKVVYISPKGLTFEYSIEKIGAKVAETDDFDLLLCHFKLTPFDYSLIISFPALQTRLSFLKKDKGSVSFLKIGSMDIVVKIENQFELNTAVQSYFYFFKEMPNPQASLTIKASKKINSWSDYLYSYISSQSGEITPSQFDQGLSSGAELLTMASDEIFKTLNGNGFPTLLRED